MIACSSRGRVVSDHACFCRHQQVGRGRLVSLAGCEECPFAGVGFRRGQKRCAHLGESTGTVECSCAGGGKLQTFACSLHGECLLTEHDFQRQKNGQRYIRKRCETCKDRTTEKPGEPLNIGVVNQAVVVGGAEVWAGTMSKHSRNNWSMWSDNPAMVEPIDHIETFADDWLGWRDRQDVLILWSHLAEMVCPRLDGFAGKVVVLSHGDGEWTRRYMESLAPIGDVLAAVSSRAALTFPAEFRDRVNVIVNGVEPERVVPTLGRNAARRVLGIEDKLTIAFIGRYCGDKNPTISAKAAALIPGAVGLYKVPKLFNAVEELKGLPVAFSDLSVADSFAAADVFVLASPSEGCGVAILEAWAAGIPVVCTQVGGIPEIEAENGPLTVQVAIDPTAEEVAQACREAMERREELIAAGLAYSAKYAAKDMAERWDSLLSSVP